MQQSKHSLFQCLIFLSLVSYTITGFADAGFRPLRDGQYAMIVNENGQCVEADPRGGNRDGTRIQLGRCDGSPNQLWTHDQFTGALVNRNGKCLDADANARNRNGARLQLWECHGGLNQDWVHRVFRDRDSVRSAQGRCIDAMNESYGRPGTPLQLWDCNASKNQQFWGEASYGGRYPNRPDSGRPGYGDPGPGWGNPDAPPPVQATRGLLLNELGKCLTIDKRRNMDKKGTPVWGAACKPGRRGSNGPQFWRYEPGGSLINAAGLCLDIDGPQIHRNGGKVQIWECNNSPNQQWRFDDRGRMVNQGGLCLDMDTNTKNNPYTKVHIWKCKNSENQRWRLQAPRDFR